MTVFIHSYLSYISLYILVSWSSDVRKIFNFLLIQFLIQIGVSEALNMFWVQWNVKRCLCISERILPFEIHQSFALINPITPKMFFCTKSEDSLNFYFHLQKKHLISYLFILSNVGKSTNFKKGCEFSALSPLDSSHRPHYIEEDYNFFPLDKVWSLFNDRMISITAILLSRIDTLNIYNLQGDTIYNTRDLQSTIDILVLLLEIFCKCPGRV